MAYLALILFLLYLPISFVAGILVYGLGGPGSPEPSFQLLVSYFLFFIFFLISIIFLSIKGIKKAKDLDGEGKKLSISLLILASSFLLFRLYKILQYFLDRLQ
ncbi:hypothetical protein FJZ41_01565 [Candidatus Shapirobacteria bacterium]|nr:hypothetical protein [Candidatus Shapirobacteria bacterium]